MRSRPGVWSVPVVLAMFVSAADASPAIPDQAQPFLTAPSSVRPLPVRPQATLIAAVRELSDLAGIAQDPGPAIRAANLSDVLAGRLANVATSLGACIRARGPAIRACAVELRAATRELERSLHATTPPASIDLWPVLRLETAIADDVYNHDSMLLVDAGGNDTYMNNAGSNVVDVKHGPPGSLAPEQTEFAAGCQTALAGVTTGDCTPFAAVLLDMEGDDAYGVKQSPEPGLDGRCTAEPIIRRQVTGGVGFIGVGILRDVSGDDTYEGKTSALGHGHISGVGVLSDGGGNDSYTVVRNGIGMGLVGGIGILHDEGGNDSYGYRIPAPLDPDARNETDGAGGVIDDTGQCDNRPRFTAGAANFGSIGVLVDGGGDDRYIGGYSDDYAAPFGIGRGGSLGFGENGGLGTLIDAGGTDAYTIDGAQGDPVRADGVTIPPGAESTGRAGAFTDR